MPKSCYGVYPACIRRVSGDTRQSAAVDATENVVN
jgi:hypothetical protein